MPMHRIYTTPGLYLPREKRELAKAITKIYTSNGLPEFYVLVLFIDIPTDSFYVGGEQICARGVARFNVQHLARQFPDKETKLGFMKMYEDALKPFTVDKKLDWEINLDEADPLVWHINGVSPPAPKSEGEKLWVRENKPTPFEGPSFSDIL